MMKNSTVPEIASLAKKHLITEDYWNDTSDNIQVMSEQDIDERTVIELNREGTVDEDSTSIFENEGSNKKPVKLRLLPVPAESGKLDDLLSPALTYNRHKIFASSPIARFANTDLAARLSSPLKERDTNEKNETGDDSGENLTIMDERQFETPPVKPRR